MPVTNETPCDDGLLRTDFDQCVDGVCVGTDLCDTTECAPPAACRQEGVCFRGNCTYELLPQGAQCSDGDPATDEDTCTEAGACVGIDYCDTTECPLTECQVSSSCYRGVCTYVERSNGTACTDTDGNECTAAQCYGGACVQDVLLNNVECDDGDELTDLDTCTDGVCAGVDLCIGVQCAPAEPCYMDGVCRNGVCSYEPLDPGTQCSDGNPATDFDACTEEAECVGIDLCVANDVTCPPPSEECKLPTTCFRGECLPYPFADDGSVCTDTDNNTCTVARCSDGSCMQSTPVANNTPCDDNSEDTR